MGMIDEQEVEKLSKLSRLSLTPEERSSYAQQMRKIIEYISLLKGVTEKVEREGEDGRVMNVFREDLNPHTSGEFTEKILAEAPSREGNFVRVKKIL